MKLLGVINSQIGAYHVYSRNCFILFQSICNLFSSLVTFILICYKTKQNHLPSLKMPNKVNIIT